MLYEVITDGGRKTLNFSPPDPEVPANKARRKFTAKYKLRILKEAEACTEPGQIGTLLRREGLYSSHLTTWRRQREDGLLQAMAPKKRGRRKKEKNPLATELARLENENRRLKEKLRKAETIIEVQKKNFRHPEHQSGSDLQWREQLTEAAITLGADVRNNFV